jgi:preprotein translocase subunit SecF
MQLFVNSNYDFVKWRNVAVLISVLVIAAGVVTFFMKGMPLGIDFAGGANVALKFRQQPPLDQLRASTTDATIQQFGKADENSVQIRLPRQASEGDYAGQFVETLHKNLNKDAGDKLDVNYYGKDRLASLLLQNDPDRRGSNPAAVQYYNQLAERIISKRSDLGIFTDKQQLTSVEGVTTGVARVLNDKTHLGAFNVLNQETVGPQVGKELQRKAMWAIILSSLAMAIYIAVRFEQGFIFGVAGLTCIIHDVLVAMAFLVMMRLEFSLNVVAALLTIVGYSINDNVVMYDRVRENRRKSKTYKSLGEHLNKAINDTLSRTVLTAGSVFLVLLALLIFGGEVIRDFAWILLVGVVVGTFSTLFLVPAVAVNWDNRTNKNRRNGEPPATAAKESARNEVTARRRKAS